MIKVFGYISIFIFSFKSHGEVPFWEIKGMHEIVKNPIFSPVEGFLSLKTRTLERIRFYGPYELDGNSTPDKNWIHPAFLAKENDPHTFFKRFEYPFDPISALLQWLFPSMDGALFVANERDKDIIGNMGRHLKNVSNLPLVRSELKLLQSQFKKVFAQESLVTDLDSKMDKLREERKAFTGKLTDYQITQKNKIGQDLKDLAKQKDKLKTQESIRFSQDLNKQIEQKIKLIEKLELMPRILKCIHEGILHPSYELFQSCLKDSVTSTQSAQQQNQKTTFIQILYKALLMDGTFSENHNSLYPKHIALHALLGYMWHICDNKSQFISVMREAEILKKSTVRDHKLTSAIVESDKYTRVDYESIKTSTNPTFEQLAYAGYGYEAYENPNPEMIIYGQSDINVSEKDLIKYPYLISHTPYPDCGETALRNLFNLVAFKGAGEFNSNILPDIDTPYMKKIRQFYHDFPNISAQKTSLARIAWSTIVSNLNKTSNSSNSQNPMDVQYYGYTNIKGSLGIKNILNVMAKLTGDSALSELWETGEQEKSHIAQKLNHLCQIFSRGQGFEITWEIDGQNHTAPIHGDFKFIIKKQNIPYVFIFSITNGHFALHPPLDQKNDWRTTKMHSIDIESDLLKSFYDYNPSLFLNPLVSQNHDILRFWRHKDSPDIFTLRFLYKNFGSVINDENAQRAIMKILNLTRTPSLATRNWLKALFVDKSTDINKKDENGITPLMKHARNGHKEIIEILLEHGANINEKDDNNKTALIHAFTNNRKNVIESLLRKGANANDEDEYGSTALIYFSPKNYKETVKILLEHGANIEAKNKEGNTALMLASAFQNIEIVEILLENGANIETKNKEGNTALILASWRGNAKIIQMLEEEKKRRAIIAARKIQKMMRKKG